MSLATDVDAGTSSALTASGPQGGGVRGGGSVGEGRWVVERSSMGEWRDPGKQEKKNNSLISFFLRITFSVKKKITQPARSSPQNYYNENLR